MTDAELQQNLIGGQGVTPQQQFQGTSPNVGNK